MIARVRAEGCDAAILGCTEIRLSIANGNWALPDVGFNQAFHPSRCPTRRAGSIAYGSTTDLGSDPSGCSLQVPGFEVAGGTGAVQTVRMLHDLSSRRAHTGFVFDAVAAAAILCAMAGAACAAEAKWACAGLEPGPTHSVTRVLDGETVVLDDGRELRLIGALAPRAIDADAEPGAWPMEAAAAEALRALVLGKSVELGFAGERSDRYGRLLAHAFLVQEGDRGWLQGSMVEQGLARAYALSGSRRCSADLIAVERAAREARRGLWAEAAYHVRQADKPAELLRYRASFQVVEGTIARVAQVRDAIYLNFDRNWRQAFSVSLRRDDVGVLGASASNPKGLEGRTVRVHGWIEQREGAPVIDLGGAGLIEVMGGAEAQPDRSP